VARSGVHGLLHALHLLQPHASRRHRALPRARRRGISKRQDLHDRHPTSRRATKTADPDRKIDTDDSRTFMNQVARHAACWRCTVRTMSSSCTLPPRAAARSVGLATTFISSLEAVESSLSSRSCDSRRAPSRTYFVHVTASEGLDAIAEARSRGLPSTASADAGAVVHV